MTGKVDIVTNGCDCYTLANGSALLGEITGVSGLFSNVVMLIQLFYQSGCSLGSVIAAAVSSWKNDETCLAALAALVLYSMAAEFAENQCRGPGTFVPAFLDELYRLSNLAFHDDFTWLHDGLNITKLS